MNNKYLFTFYATSAGIAYLGYRITGSIAVAIVLFIVVSAGQTFERETRRNP